MCYMSILYILSPWIWKGVSATLQSRRYTLSYIRWRWYSIGDDVSMVSALYNYLAELALRSENPNSSNCSYINWAATAKRAAKANSSNRLLLKWSLTAVWLRTVLRFLYRAITGHRPIIVGSMLVHRPRRWLSIEPTMGRSFYVTWHDRVFFSIISGWRYITSSCRGVSPDKLSKLSPF